MKFFFLRWSFITFIGALLVVLTAIHYVNAFYEPSDHHPAALPVTALQRAPQAGDAICCEDGSTYTIINVSQYQRLPVEPTLHEFFVNTLSPSMPKSDAIHFADLSGDYLFVKNCYEMCRMLYALSQSPELSTANLLLSIPEDAIPIVLESWDPEQILEFQGSHPGRTCCLESWDIYKNGSYQKTVYLATAI